MEAAKLLRHLWICSTAVCAQMVCVSAAKSRRSHVALLSLQPPKPEIEFQIWKRDLCAGKYNFTDILRFLRLLCPKIFFSFSFKDHEAMKKQLISEAERAYLSPEQTQEKRINPEQKHPAPRLFAGITGTTPDSPPHFFSSCLMKQTNHKSRQIGHCGLQRLTLTSHEERRDGH